MGKKRIVIACGTGIATSTVVAEKVQEICRKNGIAADLTQCKVTEVASYADGADLVVATTPVMARIKAPIIMGLSFLTGIGIEAVEKQIVEKLKG